eukprot:TRINITY_DN12095_c2_g1_i2.p1 TRINITY_DN12095_c2_g1~~TRINITY_DN12095_c2_g1_i2.p1  ORF type:complete len:213 (+),score=56.40 TRINITY_DN12095_c2_g1_i2:54-692(+)
MSGQDKIAKLKKQVRIGGKGTPRRKKKVVHKSTGGDDKKLASTLKKLQCNSIPGIEEVNLIKADGSVIHFNNPTVAAAIQANTFHITGKAQDSHIKDLMPGILSQLGQENMGMLQTLMEQMGGMPEGADLAAAAASSADLDGIDGDDDDDDDEVPGKSTTMFIAHILSVRCGLHRRFFCRLECIDDHVRQAHFYVSLGADLVEGDFESAANQ